MKSTWNRIVLASVVVSGLAFGRTTLADTVITTFDSFTPGGPYGNWSDPGLTSLTSNPTNYEVESVGFGGAFTGADPFPTNGTGNDTINFNVTVNSGDAPNVLSVLEDSDGTQFVYRWYTLTAGNHPLFQPLTPVPGGGFNGESYDSFTPVAGGVPGFNFSAIQFFHFQVDAHGSNVPYDISFNDLRLTSAVPEPASLAMLACGAFGLVTCGRWKRS